MSYDILVIKKGFLRFGLWNVCADDVSGYIVSTYVLVQFVEIENNL